MARISTYQTDDDINELDLLVGSERYIDSGVVKFRTKNYKVGDLANFFGISVGAVNTYLGSFNQDGSFSYSSAFASQTLSTVAGVGYAAATDVTALSATVVSNKSSADASFTSVNQSIATETSARSSAITTLTATVTNNKTTTDASAVTLTQAVADETSARASAVTSLNSSISIKPNIIRATSAPSITQQVTDGAGQSGNVTTAQDPAMGSIWIDITQTTYTGGGSNTRPKNEMYVLQGSAGSASWLITQDSSLLNTVTSTASALSELSTLSNDQLASASQITKLNAEFVLDGSGNITGIDPSKTISSATNTAKNTAISTANKASATRENNLTANVQKVFNQNSAPSVTLATQMTANVNSAITDSVDLVIDGQSSGTIVEGMVVTGSGISGDVVVITVTNQNTLVLSSPQTLANNAVLTFNKAQSPPVNSLWYDTTNINKTVKDPVTDVDTTTSVPGNILHVLTATGSSPYYSWVQNPDALLATQASVNTTASATADINGKLSSRYGVKVTAGGVFAGMELIARSDNLDSTSAGNVSDIIFTSTNFKIKTLDSNGNISPVAPFTVSGTTVSINGTLKIGTGTSLDDVESKANSATQASDYGTIRSVAAATSGNVAGWNISQYNINSGASANTTQNISGYSGSAGIIMNSNGSFHSPNFFINADGSAGFKGALTIGSTDLTTSNTLNENTTKDNVGLGNVDNSNFDGSGNVVGGAVGPITISSTVLKQGTGGYADSNTGFYLDSSGKFSLKENFTVDASGNVTIVGDVTANSGSFSGTLTSTSGNIGGWKIGGTTIESASNKVVLDSNNNNISFASSGNSNIDVLIGNNTNLGAISAAGAPSFSPSTVSGVASATQLSVTNTGYAQLRQGTGSSNELKNNTSPITIQGNAATNNVQVTMTFTLDESDYIARATNSQTMGSGSTLAAEVGVYYSSYQDSGYSAFTSINANNAGTRSAGTYDLDLSPTTVSITLTMTNTYNVLIYPVVRNARFLGAMTTSGNATLDFRTPTITNAVINYAIGRSELVGGGFMVVKDVSTFFKLNRQAANSSSAPFIETSGYWKQSGILTVLNATSTAGTGDIYIGGNSTNNGGYIRIFSNANSHKYLDWYSNTSENNHNFIIRHNGNTKVTITDGGSLTATGGVSSDSRVKKDIQYLELDATSVVKQLKPANFKYIDFDEKTRTGFIAQDVLKILPNLVLGNGEEENGTYGLDYDGILAIVVKGFKEQQTLIELQKTLIDNLTERVTALEG